MCKMSVGKVKKVTSLAILYIIVLYAKLMEADGNNHPGEPRILNSINPPKLSLGKVVRDNGEILSNDSIKTETSKTNVSLGIDQIKSLTFICEHSQPIQWSFECPFLEFNHDYVVTITKTVANEKDSHLYSSELTFGSKFTLPIPSNFSCFESESLESRKRFSSIFFYDLELSGQTNAFWFYVKDKLVNTKCSTEEETAISGCPVYINLDIETRTYECSNSKWPAKFYDCSASLDFCLSSIAQDRSNGTCLNQTNLGKAYKTKLEASGIIECKPDNPTFPNVHALLFPLSQQNSDRPRLYKSVDQIRSDKNILVVSPVLESKVKFYNEEKVEFQCSGFKPIFAYGFRWFTKYNNGSEISHGIADNKNMKLSKLKKDFISERRFFSVETNISEIGCEGLMPNLVRAGWAKATFKIEKVFNPIYPNITSFTISDNGPTVRFNCYAIGEPHPAIVINFCNIKCPDKSKNPVNRDFGAQVEIPKATINGITHALCVVRNFFGNATGEIDLSNISVQIQSVQRLYEFCEIETSAIVGIIGGIFVVGLIIVIVILVVKLRKRKSQVLLSEEEFEAFYKGAQQQTLNPNDPSQCAILLAYDKRYEIPREKVHLNGIVLGSGQFGVVVQGQFNGETVAVKTIRQITDVTYFKALLAELKILIYVGHHAHIVNLIGACTGRLRKLEVLLIMDYCENGNLVKFLRSARSTFVDIFSDSEESFTIYENSRILTTKELIRFSCEVADAMAFIADKNILHGDIAARNVLVTRDMQMKLCDFGLAKQLFEYAVYVQKQEVPMPLRWMAIESLQDMEFSIESDAWSFGVLLWEIFSLAEIPYSGISWGFESWRMLKDGYRMEKPQYSNQKIYNLMMECWDSNAKERPKFKEIFERLQDELDDLRNAY